MHTEELELVPAGGVDLEVPAHRGGPEQLLNLLRKLDLPASIVQDAFGSQGWVAARLICDNEGRPLCAVARGGVLHWEHCDLPSLAMELFDAFGDGVLLGGEPFEVEGERPHKIPDDVERQPGPAQAGGFAWITRERRDMLPLIARIAEQPLRVVDVDDRRLVTLMQMDDAAPRPSVWSLSSELLMWRTGERRGMASKRGSTLLVHAWDDGAPQIMDNTAGWERDITTETVRDYLDGFVPHYSDPRDWAKRFKLDAERSERLRILLRMESSTADTLSHAAAILGVPALLADVAEGNTAAESLPSHGVVHPASPLQVIRASDEARMEKGGLLFAWHRFSARHPRWRFIITAAAIALSIVVLAGKIARGDFATIWIPIVSLAIWGIDLAIPRTTRREDASLQGGAAEDSLQGGAAGDRDDLPDEGREREYARDT